MVKVINANNFTQRFNARINQKYKIVNIIEIKTKDD